MTTRVDPNDGPDTADGGSTSPSDGRDPQGITMLGTSADQLTRMADLRSSIVCTEQHQSGSPASAAECSRHSGSSPSRGT